MVATRSIYLITSLGLSPGVVTGTIDALQYGDLGESYSPTHVAVITTDNELTRLSLEVVEHDIKKHNPQLVIHPFIMSGLSDINTRGDNYKVMKMFVSVIREGMKLKEKGAVEEIHVNIAGGRKTMSGIFTTLSNIFPVDMVYHLITSPEIEREGNIKNFLRADNTLNLEKLSSEESKRILHPKAMGLHAVLVEIPILRSIDFNDLLDVSLKIHERRKVHSNHHLIRLMVRQGLLREKGRETLEITSRGHVLFELLSSFKKS